MQTMILLGGKLTIQACELENAFGLIVNGETRSVSKYPHPHVPTPKEIDAAVQTAIDFLISQGYDITMPLPVEEITPLDEVLDAIPVDSDVMLVPDDDVIDLGKELLEGGTTEEKPDDNEMFGGYKHPWDNE
ncbi:MAG: hypothetical protein EB060_00745 [Proteobacteria bacterium]|nr:hypothetical protein [Pseudomonadota bacterium]